MPDHTVLYTAPCGCQAVAWRDAGVTWGVIRCEQHPGEELAPEIADYYRP
jgi:hypothetical protein